MSDVDGFVLRIGVLEKRIEALEAALRELVEAFNPEPKTPALTIWDRAAAILNKTA